MTLRYTLSTPRWRSYLLLIAAGLAGLTAWFFASQRPTYYSGLSPIPGYRLWNATQPRGFTAGWVKDMQGLFEVTPCEYTILGWDAAGALYYEALCANRLELWSAHPEAPDSVRRIGRLPADVSATPLSKGEVLPLVRAVGVWPANAEPPTREVYIRSQPYPSPDGAWLAFVSERVYGPQDVLLLSAER